MKVNILTNGFLSPTSRGWLHPIVKNKSRLFEMGIDLSFHFKNTEEIKFCDVVIVESKFIFNNWNLGSGNHTEDLWLKNRTKIHEFLINLKTENNKVFYYELGDSTYSWGLDVLPHVDKLLKPFIFKDKSNYCVPLDECNLYTDYYSKKGIIKANNFTSPKYLTKKNNNLLDKIQVGFNSAFADHGLESNLWKYDYGNRFARRFFKIYSKMLNSTKGFEYINPESSRIKDLSCRILSKGYRANGISFHRNETARILNKYISTNKLNRKEYFFEMRNSKVVVSPFGWGEINVPRDYEVALTGAILVKPDISHIDTWPNIFNKDTVVQYKWDLSNLLESIDKILDNYDDYIEFAIRLQDQYKKYSFGELGKEKFCEYFINMIRN